MEHDGKSTGLFSDEEPKKKGRKIKISEAQYTRLFKEKEISEQDEGGETSDSGGSSGGEVWTSGASSYTDMATGPGRPTKDSKWESGVTRGVGNSWV